MYEKFLLMSIFKQRSFSGIAFNLIIGELIVRELKILAIYCQLGD